jgi:hypothetical protein
MSTGEMLTKLDSALTESDQTQQWKRQAEPPLCSTGDSHIPPSIEPFPESRVLACEHISSQEEEDRIS